MPKYFGSGPWPAQGQLPILRCAFLAGAFLAGAFFAGAFLIGGLLPATFLGSFSCPYRPATTGLYLRVLAHSWHSGGFGSSRLAFGPDACSPYRWRKTKESVLADISYY
jgi:hypothetical protein